MITADHPDIPFVESRTILDKPAYTLGRPTGPPIWVVIHDMEFPERDDAAEWTAGYFARGADGRNVSSHYCADRNSIVQCVRLRDSAWTVGNWQGNNRGINWELAGYASQTREQWSDPFSAAMLERVAGVMRRDMVAYRIPARTLTDDQCRAFAPGVTSHVQLGRVFGGSTHTDPGKGFPWDVLLALLEGDDMPTVLEFWGARWPDYVERPDGTRPLQSAVDALFCARRDTAALLALAAGDETRDAVLELHRQLAQAGQAAAGAVVAPE